MGARLTAEDLRSFPVPGHMPAVPSHPLRPGLVEMPVPCLGFSLIPAELALVAGWTCVTLGLEAHASHQGARQAVSASRFAECEDEGVCRYEGILGVQPAEGLLASVLGTC